MNKEKKVYNFSWDKLGDIVVGRENLGTEMPVLVYRLFQYSLKDILSNEFDAERANDLIRKTGYLAGSEYAKNALDLNVDFDFFVAQLQQSLKDLKVGILRIEKSDLENLKFTLTVSEDLDCSGLPVTDETVCNFDEGFIAGILETYTKKPFEVIEVDCWASGDRICRFTAEQKL